MSLFDLNQDYQNVLSMLDEGVEIEVIQDTLDSIEADISTKVDNTVWIIKTIDGEVETIGEEIKRLQGLKKSRNNLKDKLKGNLQLMLENRNLKNYRTSINYIYRKTNAPRVHVTDESKLDKSYYVSLAPRLNKELLSDKLKAGVEIPGVELRRTESLVVK